MTGGRRRSFGTRLFLGSSLVAVGCVATAGLVATMLAQPILADHLDQAGIGHDSEQAAHVEMAMRGTATVAWAVAAVVAILIAVAISWYLARRVERSVRAVAESAADIAHGRLDTRVDAGALGREFADLSESVNELARRLESTETTRRRMLADLGHEMRTPIATIDSHLEAVEDGVREMDAETLRVLRTGTDRLRRLVEDVTAVSRVQEGRNSIRPRPTTAGELVDAAVTVAAPAYADAGVTMEASAVRSLSLTVDPDRIGQVLGNLLDNARRHTPRGGTVAVTVDREHRRGGDVAVFTVADTGSGIAAEHLDHVFDRFYRADPSRSGRDGGSGIGLTIVATLVADHGGTVTAHSDGPGAGSTFVVRLPVDRRTRPVPDPSDPGANLDS